MTKVTITGLRYLNNCKTVFAYGMYIDVPNGTRFLTIDVHGILQGWVEQPSTHFYGWRVPHLYRDGILLGNVLYTGDWADSLTELPSE